MAGVDDSDELGGVGSCGTGIESLVGVIFGVLDLLLFTDDMDDEEEDDLTCGQ